MNFTPTITTTNPKGQIVIPQPLRQQLGITKDTPIEVSVKGQAIYLHPIKDIIRQVDTETTYLHILKATQGSWGKATVKDTKTDKTKSRLELKASKERRQSW
jgi:AbrB family looped-hinge helix DNA binding protein